VSGILTHVLWGGFAVVLIFSIAELLKYMGECHEDHRN